MQKFNNLQRDYIKNLLKEEQQHSLFDLPWTVDDLDNMNDDLLFLLFNIHFQHTKEWQECFYEIETEFDSLNALNEHYAKSFGTNWNIDFHA